MSSFKAPDRLREGRRAAARLARGAAFGLMEQLEPRLLLSASEPLEVFYAQDALFAENAGQWDNDEIHFGHSGPGAGVWFTDDSIDFVLTPADEADAVSTAFSLEFDGALATVPTGADRAETIFNYHTGSDASQWVDGANTFKTVVYEGLYAGIDLHTFSRRGQMKYEFHVSPGADADQIQLSYAGIEGLWIDDADSLRIATGAGEIVDEGLYVYQDIDGRREEIAAAFELIDADTYTFRITGDVDPNAELIIDPALMWSTYVGGSADEGGGSVAVDAAGNVHVTGLTHSTGWTVGGTDTSHNGISDVFVAKLSPSGNHLWSTFLGGDSLDEGNDIAVSDSGDVYVTGTTMSAGWVSGGMDTTHNGSFDIFVMKLTDVGAHVWSTYMGGDDWDVGEGIAVDGDSAIYVAGSSLSAGWTADGDDVSYNGVSDAFVVRLNSGGTHIWSTYVGGDNFDEGADVVVDASGAVYVAGRTLSSGWVSGGYDTTHAGVAFSDAFTVKLTAAGAHVWSTYMGGSQADDATGLAVTADAVLVGGQTESEGWTSGGHDTSYNGGWKDAFVVKLTLAGAHVWSTYLGGTSYDAADALAIDDSDSVYVIGGTESSTWVSGGMDVTRNGGRDVFVVRLLASGAHVWSTYVGGDDHDYGGGVAIDAFGEITVAGSTASSGWVSGGSDVTHNGGVDIFLARIVDDDGWHFTLVGNFGGDNSVGDGLPMADVASRAVDGNWNVGLSTGSGFAQRTVWTRWSPSITWSDPSVGDFNGDGLDDIMGRDDIGRWIVGISDGSGFTKSTWARWTDTFNWSDALIGDFNNDGKDDVAGRNDDGQWVVGLSDGSSFTKSVWTRWPNSLTFSDSQVGDFNADGRDDIAGRDNLGRWFVSMAEAGGGFTRAVWGRWASTPWRDVRFGDFNGDGKTDITGRRSDGRWLVGESTGTTFEIGYWASWGNDLAWSGVCAGDFDNDGFSDLVGCDDDIRWRVGLATDSDSFNSSTWDKWTALRRWRDISVADFDGDGVVDIIGRNDLNKWRVGISSGSGFADSIWDQWQ